MKRLFLTLLIVFAAIRLGSGEDRPVPSGEPTVVVELPLVDDQYNAAPLRSFLHPGQHQEHLPEWHPFGPRVRLSLLTLQTSRTIDEYEILPDRIRLRFSRDQTDSLRRVLMPPRLLGLDQYSGQPQVIIFVHGLEGGEATFSDLAEAMRIDGWFPMKLVYANDGPIEPPAELLRDELLSLHRQFPRTRTIIIAHSLGGLIAWKAMSDVEEIGVTDLVTLGTPFNGSSIANFQAELELIDVLTQAAKGNISTLDILSDGDGEAVEVLRPTSNLRKSILRTPLPAGVRLHLAAGSGGPISPAEQPSVRTMVEQWIVNRRPAEALAADLRTLIAAPEIIQGQGDGAVTVASATAIKTATSFRIFDRSHTGLLKVHGENDELLCWIQSQLRGGDQE